MDAEVCACGAQRLVDQEGKPRRHPIRDETAPYANPTGRIDWITQITQDGSRFIIDNPEDSGGLTAGARVAVLRHSVETGAVVKVQGTVTAVDQAGARFAVTGPWANQEDLLKDVSAAEISRFLGVSRTTVYRYLGPGWKRRTKAEAHQPAAGVADAAGHDLTDQPARLDRGP
jgi:hypothetical protein